MHAKLIKNSIPTFSRYAIPRYRKIAESKAKGGNWLSRHVYKDLVEKIRHLERRYPDFLAKQDRFALPSGQMIEILEIWHTEWPEAQKKNQELHIVPTPHMIPIPSQWCVRVRARNFSGDIIETIVSSDILANISLPQTPPEGWNISAERWREIRNSFSE